MNQSNYDEINSKTNKQQQNQQQQAIKMKISIDKSKNNIKQINR